MRIVDNTDFPVKLIDCTLREGYQHPGVYFDLESNLEIATRLKNLGVSCIEMGHPQIGEIEKERVKNIVSNLNDIDILCHARANEADVLSVYETGANWVGIFVGVNKISMESKYNNRSLSDIFSMVENSVALAKKKGMNIRFTVEDASRTCIDDVIDIYKVAISAGADRICYSDTVGIMEPPDVKHVLSFIKSSISEIELEVHFHNDRGLAIANSLAAIGLAEWISCSINGLGERSGITDTISLYENINYKYKLNSPRISDLIFLSKYVQAKSRVHLDQLRPFVGANAYTHCSKLHINAYKNNKNAYIWNKDSEYLALQKCHQSINKPQNGYINSTPEVIGASELKYHKDGCGYRYLLLDDRVVPDSRMYCIARYIPFQSEKPSPHVDSHTHICDSLFVFLGENEAYSGLRVRVMLNGKWQEVESPASVFIPAGVEHTYEILSGSGTYLNYVLAGNYNDSLLEV